MPRLCFVALAFVVGLAGVVVWPAAAGAAVGDAEGVSVARYGGADRYDTAVKAAELVSDRYSDSAGQTCFTTGVIGLARARVPFDSFSAAPLLDRLCAPLVLADPKQIPSDTATYLDAAREVNDAVGLRIFGGDAAVSQSALDAYLAAGISVADHDDCRPPSLSDVATTVGFPLPDTVDPSSGEESVRLADNEYDFSDTAGLTPHRSHAGSAWAHRCVCSQLPSPAAGSPRSSCR